MTLHDGLVSRRLTYISTTLDRVKKENNKSVISIIMLSRSIFLCNLTTHIIYIKSYNVEYMLMEFRKSCIECVELLIVVLLQVLAP